MTISTIYAINPNHHSEFIHPEFTAVYGNNRFARLLMLFLAWTVKTAIASKTLHDVV